MTLRRKTIIILSLVFIGLVGVYYAITQTVLKSNFNDLENFFSQQYAQRAELYFADETQKLALLTENWATWDEIYAFAESLDEGFIDSNLTTEDLIGLNVNFVIVVDRSGDPIFTAGVDLDSGAPRELAASGVQAVLAAVLPQTAAANPISRLTRHEGNPTIVTAYPIVDSGGGAAPGAPVFGRYLGATGLSNIAQVVGVPVSVLELSDPAVPAAVKIPGTSGYTAKLNPDVISTYAVLDDVSGDPFVVLRTEMPRLIYQQAQSSFTFTTLLFIVTGLVVVVLALWLLERSFLGRASDLNQDVMRIIDSSDLATRVRVSGEDEIAKVSSNINAMMNNLESMNLVNERVMSWLSESEEHFRSVADTAMDSIFAFDELGRIYFMNQAAMNTFGYDNATGLGRPIKGIFPGSEHSKLRELIANAKTEQGNPPLELTAERQDGSVFPVEITVSGWSSRVGSYFTTIVRDITERKRARERLEWQNHELMRVNRAKSDFLSKMSHELRTPLNAIIGFSELLMDRILGNLNKEQADCVGDIHSSGERLTVMINDVLDLSRIEAGKLEIKLEPMQIDDLLKSVSAEMGQLISGQSQTLNMDYPTAIPEFISDQKLLHQILINLVTNASKYSPPSSAITVSVRPDGNYVLFSVEDHGVGIKPGHLDKVFEAFYQVGEPGYETQEGTGLGLSICFQNVKALSGDIRVVSTYGQGSTFIFTIPQAAVTP